MFSVFNFSSIFPVGGQLTPFAPMCGRPWRHFKQKLKTLNDEDRSAVSVIHPPVWINWPEISLCWASHLGSQHDAARNRSSAACRCRWTAAGTRRRQLSTDICCTRPSSEAHQLRVDATVDRRDRQTDGRTPDRYALPAAHTKRASSVIVVRAWNSIGSSFSSELSKGLFCVTLSNPTHQLTDTAQPTRSGKIWTQPNTTNNGAYSLIVTYFLFYTQNSSVSVRSAVKIKFNCLVQPNLI